MVYDETMNTDMLFLAAYVVGIFAIVIGGTWAISGLFKLVDRAHPLAWIPLAGLLVTAPITLGL